MDDTSKLKLLYLLLWLPVVLYLVLNIGLVLARIPLLALAVVLPLLNLGLIGAWIVLKTLYNREKTRLQSLSKASIAPDQPPASYSNHSIPEGFVPKIELGDEDFSKLIHASKDITITFDRSLTSYLQPGQLLLFHHQLDKGFTCRAKVVASRVSERNVQALLHKQKTRQSPI